MTGWFLTSWSTFFERSVLISLSSLTSIESFSSEFLILYNILLYYVNISEKCRRTHLCGQWGKLCGFIHMGNAENTGFPHSCSHYPQLHTGKNVVPKRTDVFFVEIWKAWKTAILYFEKKCGKRINCVMETRNGKIHKFFYWYWQRKKVWIFEIKL